jgi:hypothetical protein
MLPADRQWDTQVDDDDDVFASISLGSKKEEEKVLLMLLYSREGGEVNLAYSELCPRDGQVHRLLVLYRLGGEGGERRQRQRQHQPLVRKSTNLTECH